MKKTTSILILAGLLILGSVVVFAGPWPVSGSESYVIDPIEVTETK